MKPEWGGEGREGAECTCPGPERTGVFRNRKAVCFAGRIVGGRRKGVRGGQEVRKSQIIVREHN